MYRLIIANSLILFWLIGTDFQSGWFSKLVKADATYVSWVIIGAFVTMFATLYWKAKENNRAYNTLFADGSDEDWNAHELRGAIRDVEIDWFERAAAWLLYLGLVGTLLGLSMSLDGISLSGLSTPEGLKNVAIQMVTGLKTEISASVIGLIFALWAELNYVILRQTVLHVVDMEEDIRATSYMDDDDEYDGGGGGEVIPFKKGA
jgi:hypothetical protein